jgi:NADH-quinone oxidoreductase subunit J
MTMLFADGELRGLLPFVQENWLLLIPPLLGFGAIYALLPQARRSKPLWAGVLAAFALISGALIFIRQDSAIEGLLFYTFAGIAIVCGGMMITQKNPVHAALSFALVVLSTCGLFLLQAAPFLMAATIIIYAGAIVVTFLFVIMLAQQEGVSNADQRTREPFLASLAGCLLLAALLCILSKTFNTRDLDVLQRDLAQLSEAKDDAGVKRILGEPGPTATSKLIDDLKARSDAELIAAADNIDRFWKNKKTEKLKDHAKAALTVIEARQKQQGSIGLTRKTPGKDETPGHRSPGKLPAGNVAALGKTLFTDYLIPVELAATLLLVATIGAICIAGRKHEELR